MLLQLFTAGAALVMWFGELITENGIGNGASILIFIGIISQMPLYIKNTYLLVQGGASIVGVIILVLMLLLMITSICFVQEARAKSPCSSMLKELLVEKCMVLKILIFLYV